MKMWYRIWNICGIWRLFLILARYIYEHWDWCWILCL